MSFLSHYSLLEVLAPTEEPLTLQEVKSWVRQDLTDDDALLTALIRRARARAERETGRCLVTRTLALGLDAFPCGVIHLPAPPLLDVTEVQYRDSAGLLQILDP